MLFAVLTKKSVNVIHAYSLNRGSSKTYPIRINNNVHADMYVSRLVSAIIYIPLDAYCTLLLWIGWKLARFLFTKTSVNKRLYYVMHPSMRLAFAAAFSECDCKGTTNFSNNQKFAIQNNFFNCFNTF